MMEEYLSIFEDVFWQLFRVSAYMWAFSARISPIIWLNPEDDK